jgi:hypothetical protein
MESITQGASTDQYRDALPVLGLPCNCGCASIYGLRCNCGCTCCIPVPKQEAPGTEQAE